MTTPKHGNNNGQLKKRRQTISSSSTSNSSSNNRKPQKEDWFQYWSELLTNTLVNTAVLVKKSPIPSAISLATDYGSSGYKFMDDKVDINQKLAEFSQGVIRTGVLATGVVASAAIKAGVAYQRTPGYNKQQQQESKENDLSYSSVNRIQWIRQSNFPGSFPKPDLFDMATQTDTIELLMNSKGVDEGNNNINSSDTFLTSNCNLYDKATTSIDNFNSADVGIGGGVRGYVANAALNLGKYTHYCLKPKSSQDSLRSISSLSTSSGYNSHHHPSSTLRVRSSMPTLRRYESIDSLSSIDTQVHHSRKSVCSICSSTTVTIGDDLCLPFSNNNTQQLDDEERKNGDDIISGGGGYQVDPAFQVPCEELSTPYVTTTLVHLNVGGVYYDTTLETLTIIRDSYFSKMFGSVFAKDAQDEVEEVYYQERNIEDDEEEETSNFTTNTNTGKTFKRDIVFDGFNVNTPAIGSDGRFFIDRDGSLFHHILNYLRNPNNPTTLPLPNSQPALWSLVSESKYYNLRNLEIQCRRKIIQLNVNKWVYYIINFISTFFSTIIFIFKSFKDFSKSGVVLFLENIKIGEFEMLSWLFVLMVTGVLVKLLFTL